MGFPRLPYYGKLPGGNVFQNLYSTIPLGQSLLGSARCALAKEEFTWSSTRTRMSPLVILWFLGRFQKLSKLKFSPSTVAPMSGIIPLPPSLNESSCESERFVISGKCPNMLSGICSKKYHQYPSWKLLILWKSNRFTFEYYVSSWSLPHLE